MNAKARFCGACGSEIARSASTFHVEQAAPGIVLGGRWKLVRALPPRGSAARKDRNLLWEAQEEGTGARALVQLLPKGLTDSAEHVDQLKKICELWGKVDHPAVVKLSKLESDPLPFLVLEHVDGVSLEELLASRAGRKEPFTADEVAALLPPVAEALDHLADRGLPHGAVEPGSIVVPDSRTGPAARLVEPGVSALIRDVTTPPATQDVLPSAGVPIYLSPEQLKGRAADRAADIYGLALTIAHLVGGKHPLIEKARAGDPLGSVPAALRPVLERGLGAAEMRHTSAGQLVRDFVGAVRSMPSAGGAVEQTVRVNPAPAPKPAAPAPAAEMEKTIRFVPGMADASLAPSPQASAAPAQKAAPAPAQKAAPPPAPPPEVEKTIRFVPGMTDASMAPPKPAAPPPPPPTSSHGADTEKTIRYVPGMADASQKSAPTPAPSVPPSPVPQAAAPAPDGQPAAPTGEQPQPEQTGSATIEWLMIVVLVAIALWQIVRSLR